MAWTEITRPKYQRDGLRYASDTADAEWAVIKPHLPPPAKCGRTRATDLREVVNAIFYIAQTGCQWRLLPKDFPPYSTVQRSMQMLVSCTTRWTGWSSSCSVAAK